MIISKKEWNQLTCREVLDLIKEYNKSVSEEMAFYFSEDDWRKGRLVNCGITYPIREEDFYSDNLFVDTNTSCLNNTSLMTTEEYIVTVLHQDPKANIIYY